MLQKTDRRKTKATHLLWFVKEPPSFSFGAIVLAAGASQRMAQPKLLLPWANTSILGHLIRQWTALGASQIAVVWAPDDRIIAAELDRLSFPVEHRIENPTPDKGMFSSIQCAALWPAWSLSLNHWAIILGDQPHLRESTLRGLLDFAHANPDSVCQPAQAGRGRHPVLMPKPVFHSLSTSTAHDLKEFLHTRKRAFFEADDPGLALDIDRPEDYQKALKLVNGT